MVSWRFRRGALELVGSPLVMPGSSRTHKCPLVQMEDLHCFDPASPALNTSRPLELGRSSGRGKGCGARG